MDLMESASLLSRQINFRLVLSSEVNANCVYYVFALESKVQQEENIMAFISFYFILFIFFKRPCELKAKFEFCFVA